MKPPCKDCITYAICKQRYKNSTEDTILYLTFKCSIIFDYFAGRKHTILLGRGRIHNTYRMNQIANMFEWKRVSFSD